MIKGILFDLGDVLFIPNWNSINEAMINETGISIFLPQDIKEIYTEKVLTGEKSMKNIFRLLIQKNNKKEKVERVINIYRKNYNKFSTPNPNMISLIKNLKNKYKIYAVSNTNEIHKEVNEKRGVFENFDKLFLSFEIGLKKPDNVIYYKILEEIKLKPEEILYIDDNNENIEQASKIGLKTIKFENYEQLKKELLFIGIN